MLSRNSIVFAIVILVGYFYFLGSEHKDHTLRSLERLTHVRSKFQPIEPPPQKIEMASLGSIAPIKVVKAVESPELTPMPSAEELRSYATESFFKQNSIVFQMTRLRAVPSNQFHDKMGRNIFRKMNFVFFEPSEPSGANVSASLPVLFNTTSGQPALVSGTLIVGLKDVSRASQVAEKYGLALTAQDNMLGVVHFGSPRSNETNEIMQMLRADPEVKSVSAEILETWNF